MTQGTDNVSAEQLRQFIERAERVMEEIAGLRGDLKDVFAEAKGTGFDPKIMKTIIRLRAMSADERREQEALLDTYKAALGMLDGTPLGNWAVERLTKKPKSEAGGEVETPEAHKLAPENSSGQPDVDVAPQSTVEDARAQGGEAARAGAPVTANPFPARDPRRAAWDEAWCAEIGSDGMDIPEAFKPTPKPKPGKPDDGAKGAGE